ncbi:hypothetical protein [Pseudoalteromonas xiamenensis]
MMLTIASSRSQARWDIKTTRRLVLVLRPKFNQSPLRFAAPYAGVEDPLLARSRPSDLTNFCPNTICVDDRYCNWI